MKMTTYAAQVRRWAEANKIALLRYEIATDRASEADLYEIRKHHPGLIELYEDSNGVHVAWESAEGKSSGLLQIPSAPELAEILSRETEHLADFTDDYVVNSGYDQEWWNRNLAIFRSLKMFISEDDGDGICISGENDKIYFLAHDWMDWGSKEPPMIRIADSLHDLFDSWSYIHFGCPKHQYWMSAVTGGRFTGFNAQGFTTR